MIALYLKRMFRHKIKKKLINLYKNLVVKFTDISIYDGYFVLPITM